MSDRILPPTNFSRRNLNEIVNIWSEAHQERGENIATIGVIQLILDRLHLSVVDNNVNNERDFLLSENIDLRTLDMDSFVSRLTAPQRNQFDLQKQTADDQVFAELIVKLVGKSGAFGWITHVQRFIGALLRSEKTSKLIAKTTVYFYIEAVVKQNETRFGQEFRDQMQQTSEYLSLEIAQDVLPEHIVAILCDTFFDKISRRPEILQSDREGCERIIVRFLSIDDVNINIQTMNHILRCGGIRVYGSRILRFCSSQAIVREITTIITGVKNIKMNTKALDLACKIEQAVRNRTVFPDSVYQDCVRSDNGTLQRKVAELCRTMLRGADTGVTDPVEVVIRAIMFHQQFRRNYTTHPMRLTKTFYAEFSNWNAVYEAVEMRLHNVDFIEEIFALLIRVINHIKMNKVNVENSLRAFSHKSIEFAQNLDRSHVIVYANIIHALLHADRQLQLIDDTHRDVLKGFLSEIATGYFRDTFTHQLNAIYMVRIVLPMEVWKPRFEECISKFNAFQQQPNIDYDTDVDVMATFMELGVFAWCRMIPNNEILLCNETNGVVMKSDLDLTKNRTFLAYNLIILTRSLIKVYEGANGAVPVSIRGVSRTLITCRLLEILEKTQDDMDFLCVAVFWCVSKMELIFKGVSLGKVNINVLTKYLLKKISLVTIDAQRGVDHMQHRYMVFMLDEIKLLLKANVAMDICDLVVSLNKRFPDYDHTLQLLQLCIDLKQEDMFVNSALGILGELRNKKSKEDFMKLIAKIVKPLPNESHIWSRILRTSLNKFGKRTQDSLDAASAKRAKQTGLVIYYSTMKNCRQFGAKTSTLLKPNNNN